MRDKAFLTSYLGALLAAPLSDSVAQEISKPRPEIQSRPAAPATITAVQQPDGRILVVWRGVEGAAKYSLYRSVPNLGAGIVALARPTDTLYVDSDVKAGYSYYYVVNAVSGSGAAGLKTSAPPVAATVSTSPVPPVGPPSATSEVCTLEYQRADNMWAPAGDPQGSLGLERLTLHVSYQQNFDTWWGNEKRRNDGRTYYGSHLRVARNVGGHLIKLSVKGSDGRLTSVSLGPGQSQQFQHDLWMVVCPYLGP